MEKIVVDSAHISIQNPSQELFGIMSDAANNNKRIKIEVVIRPDTLCIDSIVKMPYSTKTGVVLSFGGHFEEEPKIELL